MATNIQNFCNEMYPQILRVISAITLHASNLLPSKKMQSSLRTMSISLKFPCVLFIFVWETINQGIWWIICFSPPKTVKGNIFSFNPLILPLSCMLISFGDMTPVSFLRKDTSCSIESWTLTTFNDCRLSLNHLIVSWRLDISDLHLTPHELHSYSHQLKWTQSKLHQSYTCSQLDL